MIADQYTTRQAPIRSVQSVKSVVLYRQSFKNVGNGRSLTSPITLTAGPLRAEVAKLVERYRGGMRQNL